MKLKYKVHEPPDVEGNRPGPAAVVNDVSPWHDDELAAKLWLVEQLRIGTVDGDFDEYTVLPYDEDGNPVEPVGEADRDRAVADVKHLVDHDPDVRMCAGVLLASRQLYSLAMVELERLVGPDGPGVPAEGMDGAKRPPHPLTVELIVQAASNQAAKPFNQLDLGRGLMTELVPWLRQLIERNTREDVEARKREADEAEAARRATLVPCGIPVDAGEPTTLPRGTALVLVGYAPAVQFLLDHAAATCLAAQDDRHPDRLFTVLRFSAESDPHPSDNPRLVRVGRGAWERSCRTKRTLGQLVQDVLLPQMKSVPDLMVVDDLAAAADGPVLASGQAGGFAPFRCTEAYNLLMGWARHNAMSAVLGVLCPADHPYDVSGSEWERLRTHAIVRPVTVVRDAEGLPPGRVRIVVGRDAFSVDVDDALLTLPNQIITP